MSGELFGEPVETFEHVVDGVANSPFGHGAVEFPPDRFIDDVDHPNVTHLGCAIDVHGCPIRDVVPHRGGYQVVQRRQLDAAWGAVENAEVLPMCVSVSDEHVERDRRCESFELRLRIVAVHVEKVRSCLRARPTVRFVLRPAPLGFEVPVERLADILLMHALRFAVGADPAIDVTIPSQNARGSDCDNIGAPDQRPLSPGNRDRSCTDPAAHSPPPEPMRSDTFTAHPLIEEAVNKRWIVALR